MRTFFLTVFSIFSVLCLQAQAPQAFNYQAVARTTSGILIPAQSISVRFSILDGDTNGNILYQETQTTTTNSYGLFTLHVGEGIATIGTFSDIIWSGNNEKYLKVEISPTGGNIYTVQGHTQLLSVPYALYSDKTNLVAGNAISITNGNTISGAYIGGAGINITGNVISSTGGTGGGGGTGGLWVADLYGQHAISGNVGIGTNAQSAIPLTVFTPNSGVGHAGIHVMSNDVWHTGISMFNSTGGTNYSLLVGGSLNSDIKAGNFAIFNNNAGKYILHATAFTNFIGIGSDNPSTPARSRLHVFNGDVNVEQIGAGIIMKSPNGQCWRVTVSNTGTFVSAAIACP
ncbi:MAG: hypothetical protein ABWZ25_02445 [Chitinophagaceae bacterium]